MIPVCARNLLPGISRNSSPPETTAYIYVHGGYLTAYMMQCSTGISCNVPLRIHVPQIKTSVESRSLVGGGSTVQCVTNLIIIFFRKLIDT